MKKLILTISVLLFSVGLRADAVDDAVAAAQQLQAKISASSEFQTPNASNIQNASGDAESLKVFANNLVSQISGFNVGPVDQIRSLSADINVRVSTLQGVSSLNVGAMIEACRGLGDQLSKLQGLLPDLINALKNQKAAAVVAVQTATRWTPPTPVPGPADPGHGRPTATPFPQTDYPTPIPTATSGMQPGAAPTIPPTSNPGTLPGGPSLPPPPPMVSTPQPPQATPTPRPLLKAPMAVLAVGEDQDDSRDDDKKGDDGDSHHGGRVYVANYNMANVAILDTYLKRVTGFIPVGNQPVAMAKGGEGMVIVANYASGSVTLIDSDHDSVVATISVGSQPVDVAAQGGKAYVVNQGSNSVTIIDLKYRKVSRTLNVGSQPSRIALRDGRAYVSNTNDDSVTIIDTKIESVIATVTE